MRDGTICRQDAGYVFSAVVARATERRSADFSPQGCWRAKQAFESCGRVCLVPTLLRDKSRAPAAILVGTLKTYDAGSTFGVTFKPPLSPCVSAERRTNRSPALYRGSVTLFCAGRLLLASLATTALHAGGPPSVLPHANQSDRQERRAGPKESAETAREIGPQERAPAESRPAIGKLEKLPAVFRKTTPASLDDLRTIEQHLKTLVARVSPAVVAVEVDGATGSGVVVSEDGWVLTVAHVCEEPNREVRFSFADGKTARGKTLGMDHEIDSGLMRITDNGTWPHVEIGDLEQTRLGDWVLALGHPGGFDPERPVVARLGRIISLSSGAIRTDCTLMAGDSGGPVFDMHGRVIGIHSRISDSTADNFHVPIRTYYDTWDRLVQGERWGDEKPSRRPWIGVRGVDHPEGCRLERVDENGPAFKSGIRVGDVVTRVNGRRITDSSTFLDQLSQASPGDEVTLEIRRDDKEMSLSVAVEARARRR